MITNFSRRVVLFGIGATAANMGVGSAAFAQNAFAHLDHKNWYFLTNDEARSLAALCDTLIPEDDFPSASQVGVVDFIDLQLAGPFGRGSTLYLEGPFASGLSGQGYQLPYTPGELFRRALARLNDDPGNPVAMNDAKRASLLTDLSDDKIALGDISGSSFFNELWALTNEGFFADPMYGGNDNYAGWEMVGFPGAHAYYTDFVDQNRPYRAPPKGITHAPGTDRPLSTAPRKKES